MGKYLGAFLTVVAGVLVVVALIVTLGQTTQMPPAVHAAAAGTANTSVGTLKHATVHLQTLPASPYTDPAWLNAHGGDTGPYPGPAPHEDWVMYWPTTDIVVPAHALVTVTIDNWDSKTPLFNSFYTIPQGVEGGSITVDGQQMTKIKNDDASHTFTIRGIPDKNQDYLYVSVPITGVADSAKTDAAGWPLQPVVTTFSFVTGGPGTYVWQCIDPCGTGFNNFGGPMSTRGYMSGVMTVQG